MAALAEDLDTGVGQLIDYVDQNGLGDNTYVIYMSDNGGARSALRGGKGGLWEGGIRVPFIMRGPGIAANATQDTSIVGYDLLPTFVDIAGSQEAIPQGVEGGSFLPLATGKTDQVTRSKDFITFHFPHYQGSDGPQSALIQGNMKLVENYDSGKVLLFDLSTDPGESRDLSLAQPQQAAELQRLMRTHLNEINVGWPTQNPAYDPNRAASPQSDEVERPGRGNQDGGRGGRGGGRGGRGGRGNQGGS
jgi:arylsulfatase A-like enzyme